MTKDNEWLTVILHVQQAAKVSYMKAMQQLGFVDTSSVYMASGLLGKGADHEGEPQIIASSCIWL